ncbi:hypothetical protein [Nocardia sp. NPDC005745]|uniref:hypothetical protein n=1 Tax=Nocardia sp. NPDC005745 TaxID=3157061 RepID=UPI00340E6762
MRVTRIETSSTPPGVDPSRGPVPIQQRRIGIRAELGGHDFRRSAAAAAGVGRARCAGTSRSPRRGADAVDVDAGITNMNTLEVPLKRAMIAAATRAVAVADSSKFGRRALAKVAGIDEVTCVITDSELNPQTAHRFAGAVVHAGPAEFGTGAEPGAHGSGTPIAR